MRAWRFCWPAFDVKTCSVMPGQSANLSRLSNRKQRTNFTIVLGLSHLFASLLCEASLERFAWGTAKACILRCVCGLPLKFVLGLHLAKRLNVEES